MSSIANHGVPARYAQYSLHHYPEASPPITAWLKDPASWCVYLHGPTRSRKTSLACAVLRALREPIIDEWRLGGLGQISRDVPVLQPQPEDWAERLGLFVGPYDLAETIRNVASEEAHARYDLWGRVPLLVLDDLGKYRDTPHLVEQTLLLLHKRYDRHDCARTRTIITSNMPLEELSWRVDPATACRVAEGLVLELCPPPPPPIEQREADGPTPVQRS